MRPDENGQGIITSLKNLPGMDYELALDNFAGDHEVFVDVLENVIQYIPENLMSIKEAFNELDYKTLTIETHGIKSAFRYLGVDGLSDMAKNLEDAGRENNYEYINQNCGNFLTEAENFIQSLIAALNSAG